MNYRYAQNLKKITCEEFVPLFDKQQQELKWTDVQVYNANRSKFRFIFLLIF